MPHDSIHARTKDTKERNGYIEGKTKGYIEEKMEMMLLIPLNQGYYH